MDRSGIVCWSSSCGVSPVLLSVLYRLCHTAPSRASTSHRCTHHSRTPHFALWGAGGHGTTLRPYHIRASRKTLVKRYSVTPTEIRASRAVMSCLWPCQPLLLVRVPVVWQPRLTKTGPEKRSIGIPKFRNSAKVRSVPLRSGLSRGSAPAEQRNNHGTD